MAKNGEKRNFECIPANDQEFDSAQTSFFFFLARELKSVSYIIIFGDSVKRLKMSSEPVNRGC